MVVVKTLFSHLYDVINMFEFNFAVKLKIHLILKRLIASQEEENNIIINCILCVNINKFLKSVKNLGHKNYICQIHV